MWIELIYTSYVYRKKIKKKRVSKDQGELYRLLRPLEFFADKDN